MAATLVSRYRHLRSLDAASIGSCPEWTRRPMSRGFGTVLNVVTVIIGSGLGLLLGQRLPQRTRDVVTDGLGLTTLLIAAVSAGAALDPTFGRLVGGSARCWSFSGPGPGRNSRVRCCGRGAVGGAGRALQNRLSGSGDSARAATVRRGLRRRLAGVLRRAADDPGRAVRRARVGLSSSSPSRPRSTGSRRSRSPRHSVGGSWRVRSWSPSFRAR